MSYSVYSDFDAEKHKETFINYLEVIILEDGTVMYAVPSHQEMMIGLACRKYGVSREELYNMTPREYYYDFMTWLSMQTGAMAVWEGFYSVASPTKKQIAALKHLKLLGIYKGPIPTISESKGEYYPE